MKNCRTLFDSWLVGAITVCCLLAFTGRAATVSIQWDPSASGSVVGYKVYWVPVSGGASSVLQVANSSSASISTLLEGQTYNISVTAIDGNNQESVPSNVVQYTVPMPPSTEPTAITTTPPVPVAPLLADVTLAWDPSANTNTVSYNVYSSKGGTTNSIQVAGGTTLATVTGLELGQTYQFYVTAIDKKGAESAPSNVIQYTVPTTGTTANTPPVVGYIPDQMVVAGDTLNFAVSAFDTDLPAQTITFSLAPGAPTGAAIDPVTGEFSWTPTAAQFSSTSTITIVVADSKGATAQTSLDVKSVAAGSYYALKIGGFSNGSVARSPRGTMSALGEMYAAGANVTLQATAASGFTCTGWNINSQFIVNNPVTVAMTKNILATPVFKKSTGTTAPDQPTQISMSMGLANGKPAIFVGGELGAWVLEGSADLANWIEVASGLTSEQLAVEGATKYAFYRVRSAPLLAFDIIP